MKAYAYRDHFYILEDERVRQFLFVGDQEALLIDTGFADGSLVRQVRAITSLPIRVVLTHGDPDHAGGVMDFGGRCYLNKHDHHLLAPEIEAFDLREGDVFSCAGYRLEVVEIAGHTHGSVALWEREKRWLFAGDSVQKDGPIYLFGTHRSLPAYVDSLQKLGALRHALDLVFPSHHDCPIDPIYIERNAQDAQKLLAGELVGEPHPSLPCFTYHGRWTSFYYDR